MDALNRVEGMAVQKSMKRMMDSVVNRGEIKSKFQQVQKERSEAQEKQKAQTDSANLLTVLGRSISHSTSL